MRTKKPYTAIYRESLDTVLRDKETGEYERREANRELEVIGYIERMAYLRRSADAMIMDPPTIETERQRQRLNMEYAHCIKLMGDRIRERFDTATYSGLVCPCAYAHATKWQRHRLSTEADILYVEDVAKLSTELVEYTLSDLQRYAPVCSDMDLRGEPLGGWDDVIHAMYEVQFYLMATLIIWTGLLDTTEGRE